MNKLASILSLTIGLSLMASVGDGQDSDFGVLPPLPNLDLGDPDRKLSWAEKRKANKAAEEAQYQDSVYTRTSSDMGQATLGDRLQKSSTANRQRNAGPAPAPVDNSIGSMEDARTPSGGRLMPFGEENEYWAGMPEASPDEVLIELPPLPDLRTPDQVTRKERYRNLRVAKYEARKAEADAKREAAEQSRVATVNRPMVDPSTALVLVDSQGDNQVPFVGNQEVPETVNNGTLKPFDGSSAFYKDNAQVFKGQKNEAPVSFWWKRGTSEPGGTDDREPGTFWRNPFSGSNDTVQPVSLANPGATSGYAAGSPSLDATPLTSNLRGIKVVGSTREVAKGALSGVSGVVSNQVSLPPRVEAEFASRVGQPLTLGGLNQMVRDAVVAYRKSDLPVVDVLVPEQEITSGVLQLVVIEGRLGDVLVEGAGKLEGRALASQIRTERGEVIRESDLTEDLNWINKHPTRDVDLIFSPGNNYGETDVILRTDEYRALSAYIAYENSGTAALGESRAIFGASMTGPLFTGLDSILSYQFTTSFDSSESDITGHSGVFSSYLPWRHQVTLLGAYVTSEAAIPGVGGNIVATSGGVNKQLSGRYAIPLPNIGRMAHEFEFGMDFKSSNSDFAFGGAQVFDTTAEIVQYSLGYNIIAPDALGRWTVDAEVVSSPGDSTSMNRDLAFGAQRTGATANYTYGRVLIERDQQLDSGWSVLGRIQGQASNRNLLASESLGAGGFDSVRGFEQRVQRGDSGVVGTVELRTPTFYPSTFTGFNSVQDGAIGLLFYDAASLSAKDPLVGQSDVALGSIGAGLRYQRENWFTLRVDYGFQVTEDGFDDGNQGRWHVGARATF